MSYIGFTGTREGMTEAQKKTIATLVFAFNLMEGYELENPYWIHGDCIGADSDFHDLILEGDKYCKIRIRPPVNPKYRAFRKRVGKEDVYIYPPKEYHERNRDIVDESEILIACPKAGEQTGGTWYTINYALQHRHKPKVIIIAPNGSIL